MGTQNTRLPGQDGAPEAPEQQAGTIETGPPPDPMPPVQGAPKQPPRGTVPEQIGGRTVHQLPPGRIMTEEHMAEHPDNPLEPGAYARKNHGDAIERMIPDSIREAAAQGRIPAAGPVESRPQQTQQEIDADSLRALNTRLLRAQETGDTTTAQVLRAVIDEMVGEQTLEKIAKPRKEHPVMQRLKSSLGIQKIKPVTIQWAGFEWLFHPIPAPLDNWVIGIVESGIISYSEAKLAASIVGIDGEPIYKVLDVPLTMEFGPKRDSDEEPETTANVKLHTKACPACRSDVEVDAETCPSCRSNLDPFDMPWVLRLRCAQALHEFFTEDFGPYEQLIELHRRMRNEMPDRNANQEDLYPFTRASSPSSKGTGESTEGTAETAT